MSIIPAQAQVKGILGDWKTVDDKTGDSFSIAYGLLIRSDIGASLYNLILIDS